MTNDFIFKKVFGNNKNKGMLIDLLSGILNINIHQIEIKAEVDLERDLIDNKEGILDIEAVIDNGITIDIEMQMQDQYNMTERSLFYWSGLYYNGLKSGGNYKKNNRVVTINILNFDIFKEGPYHKVATIRREYKNKLLTNDLEMHFIQIPKFKKEGSEKENKKLWQWLKFIDGQDEKGVKKAMEENKKVKEASDELEYLTGDEAVRRKAFLREKALKDYVTNMEGAREDGEKIGRKQGQKEGQKEGRKQEKIEIAKKMLKEKMPKDVILKITELNEEEIEKLTKEI